MHTCVHLGCDSTQSAEHVGIVNSSKNMRDLQLPRTFFFFFWVLEIVSFHWLGEPVEAVREELSF